MKTTPKNFISKVKQIFKIIGFVLVGLIIFGLIFEQVAELIDKKTLKAPGQLIQVVDHKMHIYCTGESKNGSPTVILEAGGGNIWATWSRIQPKISQFTKVCSYDRSGYGFSEGSKDSRTNLEVVQELELLLRNANVPGPYVLAGHSIGGYYIRLFASRHMDEVKGLVFIDSSHEKQGELLNQPMSLTDKVMNKVMEEVMYSAIRVGVARAVMTFDPALLGMPTENLNYNKGLLLSQTFEQTNKVEDMNAALQSASQVGAVRDLSNIPIRVLTAQSSIDGAGDMDWLGWQKDIANLSTNSKQITVANTSHYIHVDQPQIVIDQILELIRN